MSSSSLWTVRQASKELAVPVSAAYRRIVAAAHRADPQVQRIGNTWCASSMWWRDEFERRPLLPRGRPVRAAPEMIRL